MSATSVPRATPYYHVVARLAMTPIWLQRWRLDVEGLEHVPRSGGAVMVLNHSSFVDFFTAARPAFLRLGRPVRILAKASLFRSRIVGPFMRGAGHIPVERGAGRDALTAAVAALRRGEFIGVLPEQTISPSFELLPFKTGAVRMAQEAGVPVVPVVSWGSHRFWTTGDGPHLTWRLPVHIRYAPPVHPDGDAETVTARIRDTMATMLADVQQRYRDGAPAGARWVPARLGGCAPTVEEAEERLRRLRSSWGRAERTETEGEG
ncbi:MAG: lysophospholipid acyltransferase family protein [Candidatus Nanopelagicales bacterium]